MAKQLFFDTEARNKMKKGVDTLANAVKVTLGPKGRNVVIEKKWGGPHVTKDGVTVAKEIELTDATENMGAQMVKEVASKTADVAGDGTTTATVLAQAIVTEGLKMVAAGSNPMDLKRGIEKAVKLVVSSLNEQRQEIGTDNKRIQQIATISANNDAEIGKLIAEAMAKVGKDGVITVETAKGTETILGTVDGMQFDRGYISPYFVTNLEKMEVDYEDCLILLVDGKVDNMKDLLPTLEYVFNNAKKPALLLIAEDYDESSLATLVVNRLKAGMKVCAVKAPGFGERRKDMMEDIAVLTGATVISSALGMTLADIKPEHLGRVIKVHVDKENTTLIDGKGKKENIKSRIGQIKAQMENTTSDYDKEKLQERLARLSGGVAILNIGGVTETEIKEKKDRVDDALHATRAAVEEGIVPGGGVAYIRAIEALDKFKGLNEDETTGAGIIRKALEEPLKQIVANAGIEGSIVVQKVKEGKGDYGFNARTEVYENLFKAGVIDPTKVTRIALENAASIAGMLLTTECVISDKPEENKPVTPGYPGAAGMGGYGDY